MPTIHSKDGFRFVIYLNDHEPSHVHVFKSGEETLIGLGTMDEELPYIKENRGMGRQDERKALFIAIENQAEFLDEWERIHGN